MERNIYQYVAVAGIQIIGLFAEFSLQNVEIHFHHMCR